MDIWIYLYGYIYMDIWIYECAATKKSKYYESAKHFLNIEQTLSSFNKFIVRGSKNVLVSSNQ